MRGLRILMAAMLLWVFGNAEAQIDMYAHATPVKGIKVRVKVLGENQVLIVPDKDPSQRYTANELPAELRKDGLHLTVDGEKGEIPPNVRMIGNPFRITCITVSGAEKRKYKLSKRKFVIRKK